MADLVAAIGANVYKALVVLSFLYSVYFGLRNGLKAGAKKFLGLWVASFFVGMAAAFVSSYVIVGGTVVAFIIVMLLAAVVILS